MKPGGLVLLVRPADRSMPFFKSIGAAQAPVNLLYLAAWLTRAGHQVEIADMEVEPPGSLELLLRKKRPALVGISVMTPAMPEAARICALCRELGLKTVLGGPHPTALPARTLLETSCDYVVMGEGEKPLLAIADSLAGTGAPAANAEGVAFLRNGAPIINKRPELLDLAELPLPDRRLLKLSLYTGETTPGVLARATNIFTSRGCPHKCSFCASAVINAGRARFFPMARIFAEVEDIISLGYEHLTVEDDTFTLRRERVEEFCAYMKTRHPGLTWDCDSRVDSVDESLLRTMKAAGCVKIAFGVESGSPRILREVSKDIDLSRARSAFALARKHGIMTQAFFMLGFPGETREEAAATEALILELDPDLLFLSIATPYPGTRLYDEMEAQGKLKGLGWEDLVFFGSSVPWNTAAFTGGELAALRARVFRNFYFRPAYIARKFRALRSFRELRYLAKGALAALRFTTRKTPPQRASGRA